VPYAVPDGALVQQPAHGVVHQHPAEELLAQQRRRSAAPHAGVCTRRVFNRSLMDSIAQRRWYGTASSSGAALSSSSVVVSRSWSWPSGILGRVESITRTAMARALAWAAPTPLGRMVPRKLPSARMFSTGRLRAGSAGLRPVLEAVDVEAVLCLRPCGTTAEPTDFVPT
jgi:hypothetical protein